eukprot:11400321-Alexandrium_andersonii.AAC.1
MSSVHGLRARSQVQGTRLVWFLRWGVVLGAGVRSAVSGRILGAVAGVWFLWPFLGVVLGWVGVVSGVVPKA